MTDINRLRELVAQLEATFDPGGTLPDDCAEWADEHIRLMNELAAALAPAVVSKCVHGIECPWWHQPWMEANSKPASPPVVAPVAAPLRERDIELVADLCERYQMTEAFKARIVNALRQSPSLPLIGGRADAIQENRQK